MRYDLLIPCHTKDYIKLKHCLNSCLNFLNPKPDNIYIVSPSEILFKSESLQIYNVLDNLAINIDINNIKYQRKNWIYQQFIKLGQDFSKNDLYLCVDSDLFFNRPIDLFDGDKLKFFISDRNQYHQPYFNFMKKYKNLERQTDHTFINDFMMFDKNICRELVNDLDSLLCFCNENLSDEFLLSEFELYGNFVTKHHQHKYSKQNTKTKTLGRYINQPWSEQEVDILVENTKKENYDLFTIHSWT